MNDQGSSQSAYFNLNAFDSVEEFVIEPDNTKHILILVPGTTDPVNISEDRSGAATKDYWDKPFLDGMRDLVSAHPRITKYWTEFSWTGDNQKEARVTAAKDLNKLIYQFSYIAVRDRIPVSIHLIGHSHGGNVINEYSQIAAADPDVPENVKIRSIVYLSTPFFTNQAQLNTDMLHPKCKIINVWNKYDLTQSFVANFSMHQMPALISTFNASDKLKKAFKKLNETPYVKMAAAALFISKELGKPSLVNPVTYVTAPIKNYVSNSAGKILYTDILNVFVNLKNILSLIAFNFEELNRNYSKFITAEILKSLNTGILKNLQDKLTGSIEGLQKRITLNSEFTIETLANDITYGIGDFIKQLNEFIQFKEPSDPNNLSSDLSILIGKILLNQIQTFDDTTWEIEPQLKKLFPVKNIEVTQLDKYDKCKESKNYDAFLAHMEKLEDNYVACDQRSAEGSAIRADIIFSLLAQEQYGLVDLIDTVLKWMDILTDGRLDDIIKQTRATISEYGKALKERDFKIIHSDPAATINIPFFVPYEKEMEWGHRKIVESVRPFLTTPFGTSLGGIPYLAVESHSVSRRKLLPSVKSEWTLGLPIKGLNIYTIRRKKQA